MSTALGNVSEEALVDDAAKVEHAQAHAAAGHPAPTAANQNHPAPLTGENSMDFLTAGRIYVRQSKNDRQFVDAYLTLNRHDLALENDAKLEEKLRLTWSLNNPSFYESQERAMIALNLAQLIPPPAPTNLAPGVNPHADALQQQAKDIRQPMAAVVRETLDDPNADPATVELLKNGVGIYLLLRQKLSQNKAHDHVASYVTRMETPGQVLSDLAEKIGVQPQQFQEAALAGGLDGIGKLLGLEPQYVAEVKQLTDYAMKHELSQNVIEHWFIGRQLVANDATLEQKIAVGADKRIEMQKRHFRASIGTEEVSEATKKDELMVAKKFELLEPIQRKIAFLLGYEYCYSPEMTADDIAFHHGIYGLHRKVANDVRDVRGTYRIYFSGRNGDVEGADETFCHENAHNFWPEQFSAEQVAKIDTLLTQDRERYDTLDWLLNDPQQSEAFTKFFQAYKAGDAEKKAAVLKEANAQFAQYHITCDVPFAEMKDVQQLRYMVNFAKTTLQVQGERYARSGYHSMTDRFREVVSRYAGAHQSRYRGEDKLLNFVAPGMSELWKHYLTHLQTVYDGIINGTIPMEHGVAAAPAPVPVAEPKPAPVRIQIGRDQESNAIVLRISTNDDRPAPPKPESSEPPAPAPVTATPVPAPVEPTAPVPVAVTPVPAPIPVEPTTPVAEAPKVVERTAGGKSAAAVHEGDCACNGCIDASPTGMVHKKGMVLNERVLSAQQALKDMGCNLSFQ